MTATTDAEPTGSTTPDNHVLDEAVALLLQDARDIRAGAAVLKGTPAAAQQRYADDVVSTLATMELDIQMARAALDASNAEGEDGIRQSIETLATAVTAWTDEIGVRSHLARMDVRDRTGAVVRRLDRASAEARRAASRVSDTMGGDLNELRHVALHSISGVRQALSDAAGAVRDLGD